MSYSPSQARDPATGRWSGDIADSLEQHSGRRAMRLTRRHALAIEILQGHGILDAKGELTALGRERQALGHKGRVIDRAARQLGRKPEEITIQHGRPMVK